GRSTWLHDAPRTAARQAACARGIAEGARRAPDARDGSARSLQGPGRIPVEVSPAGYGGGVGTHAGHHHGRTTMPTTIAENVLSWASILDEKTRAQAATTA